MNSLINKLVLVEWADSLQPISSWHMLDDLPKLEVANCSTVGWLVAEDDICLMLAQTVADLGTDTAQAIGLMRIPKICVIKMVEQAPTPAIGFNLAEFEAKMTTR